MITKQNVYGLTLIYEKKTSLRKLEKNEYHLRRKRYVIPTSKFFAAKDILIREKVQDFLCILE